MVGKLRPGGRLASWRAEPAGPPKRQLGLPGLLAELGLRTNTAEASRLARRIEPAEREHGGRALRETPARPNCIPVQLLLLHLLFLLVLLAKPPQLLRLLLPARSSNLYVNYRYTNNKDFVDSFGMSVQCRHKVETSTTSRSPNEGAEAPIKEQKPQ